MEDESLILWVTCVLDQQHASSKKCRTFRTFSCCLDITVYGPHELFSKIGDWFQQYEVYLQDPAGTCHPDTKYCNPHRMSTRDLHSCPSVSDIVLKSMRIAPEEIPERPDFLEILSSSVDLEETPQSSIICTQLKRFLEQ